MKQRLLNITICPENDMFEKLDVIQSYCDGYYEIAIHTTLDESFSSIINNNELILKIEDSMKFNLNYEEFEQSFPFYRYVLEHCRDKDFFNNCDILYINGAYEDIVEYLKRNPELLDKEIVLSEFLELDKGTCLKLKEAFKDFPNIKLMVNGNTELISLKQYEETVNAIDVLVDKISRYNYSPLEQLILAYDLIRDRFYVKEDENDNYSVSRDLTSTLLGDKIVCVGFANIFDAVCKKLNIKSNMFFLINRSDDSRGHARNMVYLHDEKYSIDGLYFFDPTFDCKKDMENNFLFSYRFFAKDYIEMDELSGYSYLPRDFELFDEERFDLLMDMCEELDGNTSLAFKTLINLKINTLLRFIGQSPIEPLSSDYEPVQIVDAAYDIKCMAEKSIGAEVFLKALYTVRKNQYYEEPGKYMFDVQTLTRIITNSRFRADDTAELALLSAMGFNYYYGKHASEEKVKGFITKNDLDRDMERTKLTRLLRTLYDSKVEEESKLKK